jgi:hypothetical protein
LRRESGAVISPSEFEEARKQYIPQPGDGEQTLKMKAQNRKRVLDSLKSESGNVNQAPFEVTTGGGKSSGETAAQRAKRLGL